MCCVLSRFSRVWLSVTLWTIALQAPLSVGFSRQEYRSGLLCPAPRNPGIKPLSLTFPALAGGFFTTSTTWEALNMTHTWANACNAGNNTNFWGWRWQMWWGMFEQKAGQPQTPAQIPPQGQIPLLQNEGFRRFNLEGLSLCDSPLCLASPLRVRQGCLCLHSDPGWLWPSTTPHPSQLSPLDRGPRVSARHPGNFRHLCWLRGGFSVGAHIL